ncbi:CHASE domain-containing protein [Celeribacter sp.]|uniref:CHASE domain-containing protein n=1 Tax=Celeribacter sp. TaxID=1890673 RepID=UPI003A8EBEE6
MPQKIADKLIECLIEAASYIAIALICIAAYLMLSYTELNELREEQRRDLFAARSEISAKIQQSFSNKHLIARSISAAITMNPDITQDEFYAFGNALNAEDPSIDTIAIVKGTTVTRVYSTISMENLLGRDLAERPEQLPDLEKVRQEGRTRLSGPTWLLREYPGFVMRQPVATQSADRDDAENIDIVSIVFSTQAFLNELDLEGLAERYNIVLSVEGETQPPQAIYGDLATLDDAQTVLTLPILATVWNLALTARETPSLIPTRESRIVPLILIGGVLAMMLTRYLHIFAPEKPARRTSYQNGSRYCPIGLCLV